MSIADLMKAMADAGAPFEAILIAVRAIEEKDDQIAARDAEADAKRAKDAARKRRDRKSNDVQGTSEESPRTIHGQSTDGDGNVQTDPSLPLPPNENNSNPPTPTHPESHTPRTRRAHRLPTDWQPKPLSAELEAAVSAWPAGALERELARFRDWAASAPASSGCKSDWDAAWRNWLRRADDEGRYRNGSNRNNSGSPAARHGGRPRDGAIAELDRQLGLDGLAEPSGRRDVGGGGSTGSRTLARARTM